MDSKHYSRQKYGKAHPDKRKAIRFYSNGFRYAIGSDCNVIVQGRSEKSKWAIIKTILLPG
jgi:hypothetical protein